jgi:hypothetical protein
VSFQTLTRTGLLFILSFVTAGTGLSQMVQPTPVPILQTPKKQSELVGANNLYCAGFIQYNAISTANKIIGAQDEADRYNYAQNDFLYINMGQNKGVSVGDTFSVVRPRAQFKSKWSDKGGLGFYVQEVGALEVVVVKREVAVVRVKTSCDSILLGDLVQLVPGRFSPPFEIRPPLDRFGDPSGKATGRILMGRGGVEQMAKNFVAYVDLGADDNVRVGDRLTVFRPLGMGNLNITEPERESATGRDYGFESDVHKGGRFSNQASRKAGEKAEGKEQTTARAKEGRPSNLRKVVGEAIVINVKEKTATIVITRNGQEIHTGDWVEIQ